MKPRKLHIGLNLLHAMPEIGGGWNYIKNLVTALGEYDCENCYTVFVTEKSRCLVPKRHNFETFLVNINATSRPARIAYENTKLQLLARRARLDLMHWFANTHAIFNCVPSVVTIYDLQAFLDYADYSRAKKAYLRLMLSRTARKAEVLLPISTATEADLQHILRVSSSRTTVIPFIISSAFKSVTELEVENIRNKYHLPDKFWLYVAHLYRHKNHLRLLQAYSELKQGGHNAWQLVLRGDEMGAEGQVSELIRNLGLGNDVIIMPRLSEADLAALYSAAAAMVFPSIYEGVGIPVIEAMACGCPVIASDIPAVREYAAGAALYFDPRDSMDIAEKMLHFQNDVHAREEFRKSGLERSAIHTMEPVIKTLLSVYVSASGR